jgi:hypothetical protein
MFGRPYWWRRYADSGSSGDLVFDKRVRVTLAGMDRALAWIAAKSEVAFHT